MWKISFILFIAIITSCLTTNKNQPASYIDPFICTGDDHGQTDPSAGVPFGMVKPCPDTRPTNHAGYDYDSKEIIGFSNTRFSGVGCRGTGGNIRILPYVVSYPDSIPGSITYLKNTESAIPGYYSVTLENKIKCELTSTRQVAIHKYTFPKTNYAGFTIDLASAFAGHIAEQHQINQEGILTGKISSKCVCDKGIYTFYYAVKCTKKDVSIVDKGSLINYQLSTNDNEEVNVYCAISVVNTENAIRNLNEFAGVSFETIKQQAFDQWNDLVSVVDIETTNDTLKRLFYTHLFHACQSPFNIADPDGKYRGSDGNIYQSPDSIYFHGWSIWDTFRSKLPLISLLYPNIFSQMVNSLGDLYLQGKPDWGTDTEPFLTVRTEHSIIVILDAYRKGLLPFSLDKIYEALKEEAKNLPFKSPDNILESSFDLWALSEIAKELGYHEDFKVYRNQAYNYTGIWKEKFMVMDESSDIMHGDGLYEGTLWQYRWFVPFDITGIQEMMGGSAVFEEQLDYFFDNELFNIGNQPDIQVPYLYAYTNSPWKMQKLVNDLLTQPTNNWYGTHKKWREPETRKIFMDTPYGYISEMDDDAGTMSSWYIWSAIGLYPVFPGDTKLVINTPLFDKTTIAIGNKALEIIAKGLSQDAIYIQKILFNGEELDSYFIDFNTIVDGGKLEIELGTVPNKLLGVAHHNN